MMAARPLSNAKVLIAEDRYLIASELSREIERMGGRVVGPVRTLAGATDLIGREAVNAALVDINLDGELAFPLAEALAEREVPFIFLTGYDREILPQAWREHRLLSKPIDPRKLEAELVRMVGTWKG